MEYSLILIRVFVSDMERAIRFYTESLGIRLASRSQDFAWAELDTGECRIALECPEPEAGGGGDASEESLIGRFLGISLAVEDIYATYEELRARDVEFLTPPERMPWGGVLAHLRDPDGNILTLVGTAGAA